jgi:hypothetical protein
MCRKCHDGGRTVLHKGPNTRTLRGHFLHANPTFRTQVHHQICLMNSQLLDSSIIWRANASHHVIMCRKCHDGGESFSTKAQTHTLCKAVFSMQTLNLGPKCHTNFVCWEVENLILPSFGEQMNLIMRLCVVSAMMVGEPFSTKAQTLSLCEAIFSMQTLHLGAKWCTNLVCWEVHYLILPSFGVQMNYIVWLCVVSVMMVGEPC